MERFVKPTYDELESYIENLQKQCADAQATVEALQAQLEAAERHNTILQDANKVALEKVEALQAQLKTARYDAVRAFVRGEDKMCFVCGAKEPCELKDDPSSPCTFDPTPMELKQQVDALQRVRDEFERERDQLHAALMEAVLLRDHNLRRCDVLDSKYKKGLAAVKVLQSQLSQLQALVRALPVVSEVTSDTVVNLVQQYSFHAWMLRALQLRATLDATTPDSNQLGAINDMVSKGDDGE